VHWRSTLNREESIKRTLERIGSLENHIGESQYNLNQQQQLEINIRVVNSVPGGLFKPDPKLEGGWIANELTFKAMKKDIFALDDDLIDLEEKYSCLSCKTDIDKQFWSFCPHCGSQFSKIII
jgi:hypothetical protein